MLTVGSRVKTHTPDNLDFNGLTGVVITVIVAEEYRFLVRLDTPHKASLEKDTDFLFTVAELQEIRE